MSISEEKQSPPGGPAVEHQKIGMPPRQNSQQNSGAFIPYHEPVDPPVTQAELDAAARELLWGSSPVMTDSLPSKRAQCSAGAHEWDHKTHRCIHCQTPVTSFMLQASAWNAVPLSAPSHWVYPLSSYGDRLQKISQQQTTDAAVETEVSKLRREVAALQSALDIANGTNGKSIAQIARLMERVESLEAQNAAQAALIASMSGDQFPDTDGLFKARVEASAVAAVDEPVNVEKAAQDTLDAMVARKLSRGMTEKLRDTAVESLRKGDRDASVGRAIGARFGGGLRQPW